MKKSPSLLFFIAIVLMIFSCSTDQEILPADGSGSLPDVASDAENIPDWIYKEMSFFYYWNEALPTQEPQGDEEPEPYFNSLLNPTDQFSYLSDDAESLKEEVSGTIVAMGFSSAFGVFTNSDNLFAVVEYVYPNSPADLSGLERGDIIIKINGEDLNDENYLELTSNDGFNITLGRYNGSYISVTNEIVDIGSGIIELNPVIHYEVKEVGNIKVGYLVYVDFLAGDNDIWLNSLGEALSFMRQQNISELVLDLRYNPGGEVSVAKYLASSLAPANVVDGEEILVNFQYNDDLQEYFLDRQGAHSPNLKVRFSENENNLNLSNLYVLTSGGTASASELVINGLKPYMNVVIVGEPTYGKFYGSYLLYDENDPPKHNWAIAPVVLKYANANGVTDFVNGLDPDVYLQDNMLEAKPFGDLSDPLLAAALTMISGGDLSSSRLSSEKVYEPIYDLPRINKRNIFLVPNE